MVVRMESLAALSNQSPEIPAPVPASTMFLALEMAANTANCAPVAGVTDSTPSCSAWWRASRISLGSTEWSSANFQLEILSIMM